MRASRLAIHDPDQGARSVAVAIARRRCRRPLPNPSSPEPRPLPGRTPTGNIDPERTLEMTESGERCCGYILPNLLATCSLVKSLSWQSRWILAWRSASARGPTSWRRPLSTQCGRSS